MCEQCLVNPLEFGEVFPGFWLMRARRDGDSWKKGQWGLVECNDPTYVWYSTPGSTEKLWDYPDEFPQAFDADPVSGYRLVKAAMTKGYDPDEGGFMPWLWAYLSEYIQMAEVKEGGDPFPSREEMYPSDLSIGREPWAGEKKAIEDTR